MDRLIEVKPAVKAERGMVRASLLQYGLDGMTPTATGERFAMEPHIALALAQALIEGATEIMGEQRGADIVEMKRA